ncbi:hypothetical protein E8D34_15740 [Nocardioides sp. GY 10113]|uniref:hypothetical protein n=1 Tax=Nocardioides sp. GY 10113 TaxID=2569761 RepID=UPI0010A8B957|nr:hypothetical protein [Nocardioides sp. GY 10113]TIC83574.1 hypothetical protein E8D34_15740 [Nocardioides sp. GY 10113]
MSDDQRKPGDRHRPVLEGVAALVAVGLVVGLILTGVALAGTRLLGLGEAASAGGTSTERESMYVPRPKKTTDPDGPLITLHTESAQKKGKADSSANAKKAEKKPKKAEKEVITLSAGQTTVASFGQIDLTGIYPGGEGAVLQVQRFESGAWADFEATIPVSGETFSTYVQTGVSGVNRFRVIDRSTGKTSNEVRITVR